MTIHLPECVQYFLLKGTTSLHNAKIIFLISFSGHFAHMHSHAHTHKHTYSIHLMKMLVSCPHAHKETAPNTRERQGGEATHASSFIMTEAECKAVEHYISLQEEKKKKIGKKEGGYRANKAIPPHTYRFHFSRHCQIFSTSLQMMNNMCPPVRSLFHCLC